MSRLKDWTIALAVLLFGRRGEEPREESEERIVPSGTPSPRAELVVVFLFLAAAGCAINLYRSPLFPAAEPKPAFVCPCHYSTFDPTTGGTVIFGPAGRNLPQLPLLVDSGGHLRAGGVFSGAVGPSWWGVRLHGARS